MKIRELSHRTPSKASKPALPPPPEEHPGQLAEKAEKALEARALGQELRKGKRLLFSSRHHLAR